jgi:acetyltransferase-like isoleucine patch superfamily enzyme
MSSILLKILFRVNSLAIKLAAKYRVEYFRHVHQARAFIAPGVGFGKGSDITFLPETTAARLTVNEGCTFRQRCNLTLNFASKLSIGKNNFFNNDCSINCLNDITIGDNNLFGESVKFYDHNHKFREKNLLIQEQGFSVGQIKIGNNCWFGSNCVILNNVTIGDNVVIGANVLVYKSIASNTVVRATVDNMLIPY